MRTEMKNTLEVTTWDVQKESRAHLIRQKNKLMFWKAEEWKSLMLNSKKE